MTIDALINELSNSVVERSKIGKFCAEGNVTPDEVYNRIAIKIAEEFISGKIDFAYGDAVMNNVWSLMVEDAAEQGDGFDLAEPAFAIYEAFDAGEWDHGETGDPVEKFTQPELVKILGEYTSK